MSTYLKHMGGYKYKQLMGKSYDEIQKLFDKEMKRVNTFGDMSSEKRTVKEQQQESPKRQKLGDDKEIDEHEEVKADDTAKFKKHLVIKKDDDIAIDVIPLATKPLVIVDYKLLKERIMGIDREDLQTIWKLVKIKHGDLRLEDEHERVLWGNLKVMFEPDIRSYVRINLQGYKEFDEVCADDELRTKKIIKFRIYGHAFSWTLLDFVKRLGLYHSEEIEEEGFDVYFQGGLRRDEHFNA
ncbi:hypothetical protein Tco_0309225 [Tanacetum coccineum]